jgi:hypothetical protein
VLTSTGHLFFGTAGANGFPLALDGVVTVAAAP